MVSSTLKVSALLALALTALVGCGKQGDENAGTPPPAPVSTAAAPAPAMPPSSTTAATPPAEGSTAATPAHPMSAPAPATTTH